MWQYKTGIVCQSNFDVILHVRGTNAVSFVNLIHMFRHAVNGMGGSPPRSVNQTTCL